jgi:hypothetical protein
MTTAVAVVRIALLGSSFANAVCRFRFTGTHSWEVSGSHSVFHSSSVIVGSDDICGCCCRNRLFGFVLGKCGFPFLIHRHSFV